MRYLAKLVVLAVALLLPAIQAVAQEDSAPSLPSDPSMWVNSGPITMQALKGKAALLWFYEEDCPKCRGKWPEMVALSQKFADQPIVFIAVNSGNSRLDVASYLREVSVPWPTIVDPTRAFEQQWGIPEISLQNIYQVRTIGADGRVQPARADDLEGTADAALVGAKWNVEPTSIPPALKPAWSAVEFGDYAAGAALIKKSLVSNKPELKQGATTLRDYVQTKIDEGLDAAKSAVGSGNRWQAYKAYDEVAAQFKGYELPAEVASELKQLAADGQVKRELAAHKQLTAAKKSLSSTARAGRVGAVNRLKKLVQESSDTDAGKEAAELLKQVQ